MTIKRKNNTFYKDLLGGAKPSQESGQTELLFICLTFCLLWLMIFFSQRMILHYKMAQQRQKTYLCIKESIDQHIRIHKKITHINYLIATAWATIAIFPKASAAIKRIIKALKKLQTVTLLASFYNIYKNKNCSLEQKLILLSHTPVMFSWSQMKIKRRIGGFTRFKSKKRTFLFPSAGIKNFDFFIKGEIHYQSSMKLLKTKEYDLELIDPINQAALKSSIKVKIYHLKQYFKHPDQLLKGFF